MKYIPCFNKRRLPLALQFKDFQARVAQSDKKSRLKIAITRHNGLVFHFSMDIFSDGEAREEGYLLAERMIKSALWIAGGYKITVFGSKYIYERLKADYVAGGKRQFDADFMARVYERPFTVDYAKGEDDLPPEKSASVKIGGHIKGCRIGFDGGGSDRKVSAVIDGKVVYTDETVWNPKESADWRYQYEGIKDSLIRAKENLPEVDAIGISTAGVCIDNRIMVSSLFVKIDESDFEDHVKDIYLDLGRELGAPVTVANDGDVTALAGALSLNSGNVLGISLGTSEAGGYINGDGNLNDYISELAFVPIFIDEDAYVDEWSGDRGVGAKYLSQDGAIALAREAGVVFESGLTKAQCLERILQLLRRGDEKIIDVYKNLGRFLGHAIGLYGVFYKIEYLLLLGRVTGCGGGRIMAQEARTVIEEYYPELASVKILPPDEGSERLRQSITAATLTDLEK